jgi:hypothetical protein
VKENSFTCEKRAASGLSLTQPRLGFHDVALDCCNIPIALKMPETGILSVIAFHEKAGRSQGNSGFIVSFVVCRREKFSPAE